MISFLYFIPQARAGIPRICGPGQGHVGAGPRGSSLRGWEHHSVPVWPGLCASPRPSLGKTNSNAERHQTHPRSLIQPSELANSNWGTPLPARGQLGSRSLTDHRGTEQPEGLGASRQLRALPLGVCLNQAVVPSEGPRGCWAGDGPPRRGMPG